MDDPADRWRMRLVLQDAVNDLVWPERKIAAQDAAKAAKMRKGTTCACMRSLPQRFGKRWKMGERSSKAGCSTEWVGRLSTPPTLTNAAP